MNTFDKHKKDFTLIMMRPRKTLLSSTYKVFIRHSLPIAILTHPYIPSQCVAGTCFMKTCHMCHLVNDLELDESQSSARASYSISAKFQKCQSRRFRRKLEGLGKMGIYT